MFITTATRGWIPDVLFIWIFPVMKIWLTTFIGWLSEKCNTVPSSGHAYFPANSMQNIVRQIITNQIRRIHKTVCKKKKKNCRDVLLPHKAMWEYSSMVGKRNDWCCRSHDNANMVNVVCTNCINTTPMHTVDHGCL